MTQSFRIWLSPPDLAADTLDELSAAVASNWIAPAGPHLNRFESELSALHEKRPSLATVSGTAALHLALLVAGIGSGDEVLCPDFTYAATLHPVSYVGAQPILVDSEKTTPQISIDWLRIAITDRIAKGKKPKAVLAAHLYGGMADVHSIRTICQEFGLIFIEDAAEALGARWNNHASGCWGDWAALSFDGNKIITTGGGGALLSPTPESNEAALHFAQQARLPGADWIHTEVGHNYRLSNLLAAVGLAQLPMLNQHIERRKSIHEYYRQQLTPEKGWHWPEIHAAHSPNYWLASARIKPEVATPEQIIARLAAAGIEARRMWRPMHLQAVYADCPFYGTRQSESWYEQGICLPTGSRLTTVELQEIVDLSLSENKLYPEP